MDLNSITREYEKYKRKLSSGRMADLREVLALLVPQLPKSTYSWSLEENTPDVELPESSQATIRMYEKAARTRSM